MQIIGFFKQFGGVFWNFDLNEFRKRGILLQLFRNQNTRANQTLFHHIYWFSK